MSETPPFVERRKPDPQIEFLTSILHSVQRLNEKVDAMEDVRKDISDIRHELKEHTKKDESVCKAAFPDGDPDGHRRFHEAAIKRAEAEAEVWMAAKKKIIEMTIMGLVAGFSILVVFYWKGHVPTQVEQVLPRLGG